MLCRVPIGFSAVALLGTAHRETYPWSPMLEIFDRWLWSFPDAQHRVVKARVTQVLSIISAHRIGWSIRERIDKQHVSRATTFDVTTNR